ncbi:MAG: hypothetical protein COA80_00750 [Leeuwenhoekiella sp.]|nr:MAG: hypothetical protein COA80_00750 [Leeuwenhoekiella sp.]
MRIWATLKTLSITQLFKLARLFATRPFYIPLSIKASKEAMQVATATYGKTHHKSNKANAFRHALWAMLLGQAVYRKTSDVKKAQDWALKFTNLHEELFVNRTLDREMDLHNNHFGIEALPHYVQATEAEVIGFLETEAENALRISAPEEAHQNRKRLVYISEE